MSLKVTAGTYYLIDVRVLGNAANRLYSSSSNSYTYSDTWASDLAGSYVISTASNC
jgi:hypothetical protein